MSRAHAAVRRVRGESGPTTTSDSRHIIPDVHVRRYGRNAEAIWREHRFDRYVFCCGNLDALTSIASDLD